MFRKSLNIFDTPNSFSKQNNFVLAGCEFLSSSQDQINYQDPDQISFKQKQCWLIYPDDNTESRRTYFSIREVNLNAGQEVAVSVVLIKLMNFFICGIFPPNKFEMLE